MKKLIFAIAALVVFGSADLFAQSQVLVTNDASFQATVRVYANDNDCMGTEELVDEKLLSANGDFYLFDATLLDPERDRISRIFIVGSTNGAGPSNVVEIGGCVSRTSDDGTLNSENVYLFEDGDNETIKIDDEPKL